MTWRNSETFAASVSQHNIWKLCLFVNLNINIDENRVIMQNILLIKQLLVGESCHAFSFLNPHFLTHVSNYYIKKYASPIHYRYVGSCKLVVPSCAGNCDFKNKYFTSGLYARTHKKKSFTRACRKIRNLLQNFR